MPRRPRELSLTGLYHIIIRGNDRNDIFYDNQDRYVFIKILEETKEKFKIEIIEVERITDALTACVYKK